MRRWAVAGVVVANVVVAGALAGWAGDRSPRPAVDRPVVGDDRGWADLDADSRCRQAAALVTRPDPWPMVCRWRQPGEVVQGQSFPPPVADPPYDRPRIEIYVDPAQSRQALASVIAHERGHMHLTREPAVAAAWLAARGLPPGTPDTVWVEDYAEVFATLFGPPSPGWRAATTRPRADDLPGLRARFFA